MRYTSPSTAQITTLLDNGATSTFSRNVVRSDPYAGYSRRSIGGYVGLDSELAIARCRQTLGQTALVLDRKRSLVGDWDACYDGTHELKSDVDWRAVIDAQRLGAIEGPFLVAWMDAEGEINVARDGVGERTAYYYSDHQRFVFSSTLDAVVAAASLRTRINKIAVARYLAYAYLPGGPTLLEGVSEVLPGQHLRWARGGLATTQFWDTPSEPEYPGDNETELRETLRLYLDRAIERRRGGPRRIGASLSGGVDSSLVVALAGQQIGSDLQT